MAIEVKTKDVEVDLPVKLTLIDHSGAHVILTVSIAKYPPVTHAFDFNEGELTVPLDLKPGSYACSLTVQVFKYGKDLSRMYSSALRINKKGVGTADGNIDSSSTFDVGFNDFTLTVRSAS